MAKPSAIRSNTLPRAVSSGGLDFTPDMVRHHARLAGIGIHLSDRFIRDSIAGLDAYAMDGDDVGLSPSPISGLTTASISTPVQFLQNWLPGFVKIMTAARKIDELIGIRTLGSWEDEEIVQGVLEPLGTAEPYGDYTNLNFASWNLNFVTRTVVRFQQGMMVGNLEELRAARVRVSTAAEKRSGAADFLEIARNRVGFYGYNDGSGQTYGFLNDPNLPAYVTVANGASASPLWSTKTFIEITADIRTWVAALQTQSLDRIDPEKTPLTLVVATAVKQYLSVTPIYGHGSVREWIKETYPTMRIMSAPELTGANGGANVAYLFAETVDDGSSDDRNTFIQAVPSKFNALGVEKRVKGYVEGYTNATAGVMTKRPWAVYRASGI